MSDSSDNTIRRAEAEDGGAIYTLKLNKDTDAVLVRASELHECRPESVLARAIIIYVSGFDEVVRLAIAARDGGPRH